MQTTTSLGPFRGLWFALGGNAPVGFAGSCLNVRVGDGTIRPRYGYRNLAAKPSGLLTVHGLNRLSGYGDDYANRLEWVSVEDRGDGIKPYSAHAETFVRTEITDDGTPLSLNGGEWKGFSFDGHSYWVNPGGDPSLYKHEVGNPLSWIALQDSAYTPSVPDPALTVRVQSFDERPFLPPTSATPDAIDSPAGNDLIKDIDFNVTEQGAIEVSGEDDNDGSNVGRRTVRVIFDAPEDFGGSDYIAVSAKNGKVLRDFQTGTKLELRIGGVWVEPEHKEFRASDLSQVTVVARVKGLAGIDAVQGIQYTVRANPVNNSSGLGFTILPIALGGTYIGAEDATDRPWLDDPYQAADVTYGVRYNDVAAGTHTGIKSLTKDATTFGKVALGPSCPLGDVVDVSAEPDLQSPYADDETGTLFTMDLVRLDADGKWRIVATLPNTTGQLYRDRHELNALPSLVEATGDPFSSPDPAPVFSSDGFVGGFAYKGGVVWLQRGGYKNIRYSRVGNPEALSSPADDAEDLARGADFTMADDSADEPVGGIQAGGGALVFGREGVYGQAGDFPSQMTPPRKIPGSMGCAGYFAFTRFRDEGGNAGGAWLDASGENVWFASAAFVYDKDTQARPVEISAPVRGFVRRFLYEEQREAFPGLALSQARLDVDEATGSLWVVLGRRALVLRPPSPIDGQRQWEPMELALGNGTSDVAACSDPFYPSSGASEARAGQTLGAWANPGSVVSGAGAASTGAFLPGAVSRWLRAAAFGPWTFLPAEATLTALTLTVRHRAVPGGEFPTRVRLAAWEALLGGAPLDSGAGEAVPFDFADYEMPIEPLTATIADVNAGQLDARLGYGAVPADPDAYDPSKWAISYAPFGATQLDAAAPAPWSGPPPYAVVGFGPTLAVSSGFVRVRAQWLGPLADAPPFVVLQIDTALLAGPTPTYLAQGSTAASATKRYSVEIDPLTGHGEIDVQMFAKGASSPPTPGGPS